MIKSARFFYFVIALSMLYTFSACNKLEKFVTVDEANAGLKEMLTISNDSAKNVAYYQKAFLNQHSIKIQLTHADLEAIKVYIPDADSKITTIETAVNQMATELSIPLNSFIKTQIEVTTFNNTYDLVYTKQNAATDYLKSNAAADMQLFLKPLASAFLKGSEAENNYTAIAYQYNTTVDSISSIQLSLSDFASSQIIEHYFSLMAEEEIKIRTDKSHRQSTLLKDVFGNN